MIVSFSCLDSFRLPQALALCRAVKTKSHGTAILPKGG